MSSSGSTVGSVVTTAARRTVWILIALVANVVVQPIAILIFGIGPVLRFIDPELGSQATMYAIGISQWAWSLWLFSVDLMWTE